MTWVYRNVDKRPVVTVPSALEVLKTRVGDCNEHSVLLTALLRSAGIPARINVGLVYARGKFFYHAWNEAYLGTWISMDSVLNQMPTDATHIKMIEGGLQKQVDIIGLMGKLNLKIVDHRYD
jgi:transglutaminase-like putative cysteine protease